MPAIASPPSSAFLFITVGLLILAVFCVDLLTPLGVADGVMYVVPILFCLRRQDTLLMFRVAAVCSLLTFAGYVFSPDGGEWWNVIWNRGLALVVIWTAAFMGRAHQQQTETIGLREHAIQDFMEHLPAACLTFDRQGHILSWNRAAEGMYGYSKEEAIGASAWDLTVSPATRENSRHILDGVFQGRSFENRLWPDQTKNQGTVWRLGNIFPVFDEQGQVAYGVTMNLDMTKQKSGEEQLAVQNRVLQGIIQSIADPIYAKDTEGSYILANQAAARVMGTTPENILGRNDDQLFDQDTSRQLRHHDQLALTSAKTHTVEETFPVIGPKRIFFTTRFPLKDDQGNITGLVGISQDITESKQAQQDLRLTELVFNASPDHMSILGRNYRYRRVNPTYERAHGKRSTELIGMSIAELFGQDVFTQQIQPKVDQCFQGKAIHYESWFTVQNTQPRYMAMSYLPLHNPHGLIEEIVVISRDMTDRKQSEEALKASEQRMRTILDSMTNFVAIGTVDGIILDCNLPPLKIAGLQREEVIGKPLTETYWMNHSPSVQNQLHHIFHRVAQGETVREDIQARIGKNTLITVDSCFIPVKDAQGRIVQIVHSGIDVTEKRSAEELALATMNALSAHVCVLDSQGMIMMANTSWRNFIREHLEDYPQLGVGANYFSYLSRITNSDGSGIANSVSEIMEVLEGRKHEFSYEFLIQSQNLPRWFSCRITRFPSEGPLRVVVAHQEITEQKQAELRAREAEKFTTSILENLPNMVFVKDANSLRFVRINKTGEQLLGYSREQLIGKNDFDFFPEEEAKFFTSKDRSVLTSGDMLDIPEECIHTKRKGMRILHTKKVPLYDETGVPTFLLGISEDITEPYAIKNALRISESTLKSFFDSAPMMMGVVEISPTDFRHVSNNRAAAQFLGIPEGVNASRWCSELGLPPDIIHIWLTHYWISLQEKQPIPFEYVHPGAQGPRWISATVTPIALGSSSLPRCAYIAQDISERKSLEEKIRAHAEVLEKEVERRTLRIKELEQRRMEVEKLAAMSQVAAGIAHEINNPLASLVQSLTVLKRLVPRDHPQYSYTEKMKVCLDRITHITRQLYNLYRPPSPKADAVEVEWVIQSALDIMTPVASKKGVNLRSSLSVHKTKVDIAPGDLTQVLCNLIQNAVDASRPNLDVLVSTSLDQQIVTILVTDHGMGISAEILPRIFDPFFTTKYGYEGVGLGLGLALSKNLVESMGGTLQCSSQNGNGTTFRVSLPVTSDHG